MLTYRNHTIGFTTLLLLAFATGCGDSDKATGTRGLTAPNVLSSAPADGACPNTIVTATFSEAMNASTIDGSDFTVVGPGGAPVAGAVTYDDSSNTAIFIPEDNLGVSTSYTATITTRAADLFGYHLASDFTWTFTTAPVNCRSASPPISVTPPDNSTGICQFSVVAAIFPQAMNPATLNPATFTVTGPGGVPVAGTVAHDTTNKIFTFTPAADLALNTVYTVTITSGAQDAFGNALASNFVWTFTTAASACAAGSPPTVISVSPPSGASGVCPNTVVTATFSEAMNRATVNTTTFKLAAPGPTPVAGAVIMDGTAKVAEFTPSANLAVNTLYTATITTGAQDQGGSGLVSNFVWSFTTAAQSCQAGVPLGSAATFDAVGGSTVTNTGPTTIAGGDLGLSPGSAITGFPPGTMIPPAKIHKTDTTAAQAQLDVTVAYNYLAGLQGGAVLPGDLSGLTFAPGLYKNSSTVKLSAGNVTLDGQGNANAVFIFQIASTLTTLGSTHVVLAGNAQAKNVYWQVGSSATLGTNSFFKGTIVALQSITLDTGANLQGRALARNGAVTFDSNTVVIP